MNLQTKLFNYLGQKKARNKIITGLIHDKKYFGAILYHKDPIKLRPTRFLKPSRSVNINFLIFCPVQSIISIATNLLTIAIILIIKNDVIDKKKILAQIEENKKRSQKRRRMASVNV